MNSLRNLFVVTVLCGFAVDSITKVEASEAPGPGHEIYALYKAGKVTTARRALATYVRKTAEASAAIKVRRPIDLEMKLGTGLAANVVVGSFEFEAKYGKGVIPPDFLKISQEARAAVERAIKEAQNEGNLHDRARQIIQFNQAQKARLLTKEIVAFRNAGQIEQARDLANRHAAFVESQGISIDNILPNIKTAPSILGSQVPLNKETIPRGRALPICQLILAYYQAVAAEDPDALDACLLKGPGFLTGKDIIRRIDEERDAEGDFDTIGPVTFDASTSLEILPESNDEFQVNCGSVVKSFRLKERQFQQRESDRFQVRRVEDQYRIVFEKKGK